MENKKVIGIAQVLQHLKDGMTRDDIAEHYGITKAECKLLFQHEDLKGKKTIKKPSFIVVPDATADNIVLDFPVVGEAEVVVETIETVEDVAETVEVEVETVAETAPEPKEVEAVEEVTEEEAVEETTDDSEEEGEEVVQDVVKRPSPVWE